MKRIITLAAAAIVLGACWPDAEESTTAEELLEGEDSVLKAGTVAPDSVLPAAMADTSIVVDSAAVRDTGIVPPGARRP